MNFVWQTALSVLDISSSLIYQLLGRELNDTDIKLVEELFIYMSRPAPPLSLYIQELNTKNILKNQMSDLDMIIAPNKKQQQQQQHHHHHHHHHHHKHHHRFRHSSDEHDYLKELEMERIDFQTNTQKLINFIKTLPKGKDLLLITCKKNGYNLIQLSMLNLLDYSFNLLNNYKKCFNFNGNNKIDENNANLKAIEYNYDLIMQSKLELISLLLDYGCDPNRGLVLSNRNKFVINTDSPFFKLNNIAAHQDNNNNNCNADSIDEEASKSNDEQIDSSHSQWSKPPVKSLASTHLPFMLNTDLSFITKSLVDEKKLNILNSTPIDSPLLILCCVFNCHNLIGFNSHNNVKAKNGSSNKNVDQKGMSSKSSSSRQSTSSKKKKGACKRTQLKNVNNLINLNQQRRHTIHLGAGQDHKHQEQQRQMFYLNKINNQNMSFKAKRDMEESGAGEEENQRRYYRRCFKNNAANNHPFGPNEINNMNHSLRRSASSTSSVSFSNSSNSSSTSLPPLSKLSCSSSKTQNSSSSSSVLSSFRTKSKKSLDAKNINNYDEFDKYYEYDNTEHDCDENKYTDDEEDNFTNDLDLKYDQENQQQHRNVKAESESIYQHSLHSQKDPAAVDDMYNIISNSSINTNSDCSSCSHSSDSSDSNCSHVHFDNDSNSENDEYSEKLYEYEMEDGDDNYYDRYDNDVNSNCCKISTEHNTNLNYATDFCHLNQHQHSHHSQPDIDTIIKSISSMCTSTDSIPPNSTRPNTSLNTSKSLSHNNVSIQQNVQPCNNNNTNTKYKSMNQFIYEKLNKQRLELVDLLLKSGADKYLVTKLSISNLERLDKKSFSILKKWYGVTKKNSTSKSIDSSTREPMFRNDYESSDSENFQDDELETEEEEEDFPIVIDRDEIHSNDEDKLDQELRPLSPMMASLCLDDVEIFSRLYKHHQTLFNYFKPDEDYELIYYAIRFQSKKCLIYLLCSTNSDLELPSLIEQHSSSKLATSLSLPMSLNEAGNNIKRSNKTMKNFHNGNSNTILNFQQQINKNVNTMFYIIENTRSSEIIKVLLKCGFDLCKREPSTGNTTLHCLFNAVTKSAATVSQPKKSISINNEKKTSKLNTNKDFSASTETGCRKILSEFRTPKSLSKILFIMLKYGGLKSHVNTLNYEKKLCIQNLFEWSELIDMVFFESNPREMRIHQNKKSKSNANRSEWQKEFKECLRLLLKSGADLLLINSASINSPASNDCELIENNCVHTLFTSILKNSIVSLENMDHNNWDKFYSSSHGNNNDLTNIIFNESNLNNLSKKESVFNIMRQRSPSLPLSPDRFLLSQFQDKHNSLTFTSQELVPKKNVFQTNKTIDIEFMYHLFNDIIDLAGLTRNLTKNTFTHYHNTKISHTGATSIGPDSISNTKNIKITYSESLTGKYLEILNVTYLNGKFDQALKLFKLLCNFEKNLNQLKWNSNSTIIFQTMVNPQLIKNLITNWIMHPNYLCSSNQFKKNKFIKNLIINLISFNLYDPNDCGVQYYQNNTPTSNNLLNHCVKLIYLSKTAYQLELIYDLMRMLIQYGANPNLDPSSRLDSDLNFNSGLKNNKSTTNCVLAQLCSPNETIGTCLSFSRNLHHFNNGTNTPHHYHHHHQNHNHHHHQHHHNHNHHHHHHHHHHHNHHNHHHHNHNYFQNLTTNIPNITNLEISNKSLSKSDFSNEKLDYTHECSNTNIDKFINSCQITNSKRNIHEHETTAASLTATTTPKTNTSTIGSNSILLLTPTPSYASMLSTSSTSSSPLFISPDRSNNILIDTSVLFLNHYKKIVKLLFDSMNMDTIRECLKTSASHTTNYNRQNHFNRCGPSTPLTQISSTFSSASTATLAPTAKCVLCTTNQIESLDMYLERLVSNPRSLKSLARRNILERLIHLKQKVQHSSTNNNNNNNNNTNCKDGNLIATPGLVNQLPLPKRVKNYLLYIH